MNWRKIGGGLLLMLAGGFLTIGTEHMMMLHHHRQAHHSPSGKPSSAAILDALDEQLDLTSAQRDSIAGIMSHHQTAVDSAWRAIHRELGTSMDSVHMEIGRVLTPEQTEKFHHWLRSEMDHPNVSPR